MTAEAQLLNDSSLIDVVAPTGGFTSGEILQLCDGRAAYVAGLKNPLVGDSVALQTRGQVPVLKIASVVVLDGGPLYWDRSAATASPLKTADSFFLGVAVGDAASAAASVVVDLNVQPVYAIELGKSRWLNTNTLGLGVTATGLGGIGLTLAFDAVAEAATADVYSVDTVPCADGPIFAARIAIVGNGDDAALDMNCGLANATHATDCDAITESVFFHFDGNDLNIFAESDDGTTEVAATNTTVDYVEGTFFELWIDARDLTDIQIYVNGVNVLPATAFKLNAATGPLIALLHIEKTNNDTVADLDLAWMNVRTTDLT